jgi:hypothetical protein
LSWEGGKVAQDNDLSATIVAVLSACPATQIGQAERDQIERKRMRAMADPKVLLTALAACAAGLLLVGFISLDWRFFAASGLTSLAIIAIGIKAAGWRALNPFDRGH